MRLVLHIGSTKTGSSALQATLYARREALAAEGALYSGHGVVANAHHLLAAAVHPGAWRMHSDALPAEEADRTAYFVDTAAAIRAEAAEAGAQTIILSSEYFWGSLPPATYRRLAEAFAPTCVEVVAFVRRPDEWAMSSYLQAVKYGERRPFREWVQKQLMRPTSGLNYFRVINRWAYFLNARAVHVTRYEDVRDNVFAAFCGAVGLAVDTDVEMARVNPSPSPEGLRLLLEVNRSDAGADDKAEQRRAIMRTHRAEAPSSALLMSEEERAEIFNAVRISNRLIARQFFDREEPLFEPDPPAPAHPATANGT
jgi:hypothetical protein